MIKENICIRAYDILTSTQNEDGEFGKKCLDIIHSENNLRHPEPKSNTTIPIAKPNCSVTLISALGISCYKGMDNDFVIRARKWFTESSYISNGWFRQQVYVVDADPFGVKVPQMSEVTDIRHTATALLAALCFNAPVTFISDAIRNLLADDCRDYNNKGWKADMGVKHAPTDFYTTVYMLASLYFLKISKTYETYGIKSIQLKQILNNGLNAICSKLPNELGYNSTIEQTLRTNGTILFFLAPLLSEVYPDYLEESVNYLAQHAQYHGNTVFWGDRDFDVTVNIVAGLISAEKYINPVKVDITTIINYAKHFIEATFGSLSSFHPVSLSFVLFIYSNSNTYYPIPTKTIKLIPKQDKCKTSISESSPTPIQPEYCISDADYFNIVNIIHNACCHMELSPKAFNPHGEEELRDFILALLETHYENMVSGESFRKNGKTDILVSFDNKAAFIGECKIWHGIKNFNKAIKQLFNYSMWKDTKTALIVFNMTVKDFDSIRQSVINWIIENTISYSQLNSNSWKCTIHRKETNVNVQVVVALYDLTL